MEENMASYPEAARPLAEMQPRHDFFVGIDSDGCAFDTMEIKHKECFTPNTIKYWGLQAVSKYAREASEFVNLYSKWRGINRWPALVMVFDLLRERPEVLARGVVPPAAPRIREFMASGLPLSNDGLKQYMADHPDPELGCAWAWTTGVNATIADMVHDVPPFPYLRESLEYLVHEADIIVVSATPLEALKREWEEHDIAKYVRVIAGQEMGTKAEHLALAAKGRYAPDHILMIGDAPGDLKAARANDALFFPVNPGQEEKSWQRFHDEAVHRFLEGQYAGEYEAQLIAEFEKLLPDVPPWKR
jgi:beta-phosphoglucomutase-like phosphatase (HAD superfamily)